MFGEFQKLQKICNKMSTRIFKIDGEMPEIIEPKVGNPQNSTNQNLANLSQPWNLTFLEDEIFQLFFQSYVSKVPEWKIAHIEWSKKVQNIRKSPKNEGFRGTYLIPPFWEHPVDVAILGRQSEVTSKTIFIRIWTEVSVWRKRCPALPNVDINFFYKLYLSARIEKLPKEPVLSAPHA